MGSGALWSYTFEFPLNPRVDASRFLPQVAQPSHQLRLHPVARRGLAFKLLGHCLAHKLAKWNSLFGSLRLGAAQDRIWNFQCRFHSCIIPYLWEAIKSCAEHLLEARPR